LDRLTSERNGCLPMANKAISSNQNGLFLMHFHFNVVPPSQNQVRVLNPKSYHPILLCVWVLKCENKLWVFFFLGFCFFGESDFIIVFFFHLMPALLKIWPFLFWNGLQNVSGLFGRPEWWARDLLNDPLQGI